MRASALALLGDKERITDMCKYQIIFTLINGGSVVLPEGDFNVAVKAAKALIKLDVVGVVTIVNRETNGTTTFIV